MAGELARMDDAHLPATLDDLSKFALIGRDKLQAVRAEISAIKKVGLASEVLEQKRAEAQEIAELVTLSEMRMGEMLREIPKATKDNARKQNRTDADLIKPKAEVLRDLGIKQDTAERFQQMAEHPDIVQQAIAEARENDDIVSRAAVLKKIKDARKAERQAERAERKAYATSGKPSNFRLFTADIRDGLPEIADSSIDAVITDPPYPKEYIGLYGELANVASRVLKPGGVLLAMAGQSYLPQVIAAMENRGLDYHWCISYLTPGGQAPHLFAKNVNTFWKPVLWFQKGKYGGDCIGDVVKSETNDNDKRFHMWGQSVSGMTELVEKFTNPGDVVLDPFMGGATTGAVAASMGRAFIGCDIDGELVKSAHERIRGMNI